MASPDVLTFYFKWRTKKTDIQKYLIEMEKEYQEKLKMAFTNLSEKEIIAIHGIFFGLITAPFLTEESIKFAADLLGNIKHLGNRRDNSPTNKA